MKTRAFRSASLLIVVLVASLAPLSAQPAAPGKTTGCRRGRPRSSSSECCHRDAGGTGTSRDEPDTAAFRATGCDADRSADDAHAGHSSPGDSDAVGHHHRLQTRAGAFTAGADVHQSDSSDDPPLEHRRTSVRR